MLGNIKAKLQHVQQDLSESIKTLTLGDDRQKHHHPHGDRYCDPDTGSNILSHYQEIWKELHENSDQNAKRATVVDSCILNIHKNVECQWSDVRHLNYEICMIPELTAGIQDVMSKIGELEGLFEDVQSLLTNLESIVDVQKMQELQLEEKFRLAMYKEKKLFAFEELKAHFSTRHAQKVKDHKHREGELMKERQEVFKEVFEQQMKDYKERGHVGRTSHSSQSSTELGEIVLEDNDPDVLNDFLNSGESNSDSRLANNEDGVERENTDPDNETVRNDDSKPHSVET